jgi:YbbR domain-containing protein
MAERPALFRNLGLKLLALAIALIVWFSLAAQRRERISERTYRIPLSVVNIPPKMVIASPLPFTVDVRVRGPFTSLRQLDPGKLEAVVDLSDAPRGEKIYQLAPEDINVPQEVEVISISPSEIRIALDSTAEKVVPIAPNVIGHPAAGYVVSEVQVEPRFARVAGPASSLGSITQVPTAPVSIGERSSTFSVPATVLPDAPGVRVREGQIVTVTVRIRPAPSPTPTPEPAGKARRR